MSRRYRTQGEKALFDLGDNRECRMGMDLSRETNFRPYVAEDSARKCYAHCLADDETSEHTGAQHRYCFQVTFRRRTSIEYCTPRSAIPVAVFPVNDNVLYRDRGNLRSRQYAIERRECAHHRNDRGTL